MTIINTIKIVWNIVFMVTAVLSVALFMYWTDHKNDVNLIGQSAIEKYREFHEVKAKKVLSHLESGKIDTASKLLNDWEKISRGDQIYRLKRKLLLALSEALYSQKKYDELLNWATIWQGLDERDITAKAYWFEALRHSTDRQKEGLEGLIQTWQHFPTNNSLTRFYANFATKTGDISTLKEIVTKYIGHSWKIYWSSSKKFNKKQSTTFKIFQEDNNQWNISGRLPANIKQLRIDPPSYSKIKISEIQLTVNGATSIIPIDGMKLVRMIHDGKWLKTRGKKDPSFTFNVNKHLYSKENDDVNVIIRFQMMITLLENNGDR